MKIETNSPEETLEVIVRPGGGRLPLGMKTNGKALWRKREVMKQERSVHYTTIDDDGGLQVRLIVFPMFLLLMIDLISGTRGERDHSD